MIFRIRIHYFQYIPPISGIICNLYKLKFKINLRRDRWSGVMVVEEVEGYYLVLL